MFWTVFGWVWFIGFALVALTIIFFEVEEHCELRSSLDHPWFSRLGRGEMLLLLTLGAMPLFNYCILWIMMEDVFTHNEFFVNIKRKFENFMDGIWDWFDKPVNNRDSGDK